MVKEVQEQRSSTYYYCEKCNLPHSTYEGAEACEATEAERVFISGAEKNWQIGDIAFVYLYSGKNSGFRLMEISREYESYHRTHPFWVSIDGFGPLPTEEEYDGDDRLNYTPMHQIDNMAVILNEERTRQLMTIADVLRSFEQEPEDESDA